MEKVSELGTLFEYATEGILVANKKGEILRINKSGETMFGNDKGELNKQLIETLIPKRYTENHVGKRDAYMHDPHPRAMGKGRELFGIRKDGKEFPVEVSLSHYQQDDEVFAIAFIVDITERKEAQQKLQQYSIELEKRVRERTMMLREAISELERNRDEINNALQKQKDLNDLKTRFVSMASHEFRTPLSTILSSVSLISKYNSVEETEKRHKHIARIKSSVTHLTDILNDLLSIGKLEEGAIQNDPNEFNIFDFMDSGVQEMQAVAKDGQLLVYNHISGSTSLCLDKKLLRNIMINLMSNAIKFSPEKKEINISTEVVNSQLIICVKDQGMGISEEDQKHLFERFFRGHNATNIQGTGLGLNIVLRYLELMNGQIDLKSKLEEGTEIKLTFNLNTK